jgi:hypothetical protein
MGGLGNQLFQYATGRALALKHQTELKLDLSLLNADPKNVYTKRELELNVLNISSTIAASKELEVFFERTIFQKIVTKFFPSFPLKYYIGNQKGFEYDEAFELYPDNSYLNGYWQSEKYFSSIREILSKELVIKRDMTEQCKLTKDLILNSNSVSLHIRRGDYLSDKNAKEFHGTLPLDYYYKAMAQLNLLYKDLKVFIFSDDMDWVKANLKLTNECVYVDFNTGENSVFDMYLMSQCKHNIIANSSFSWWGAWLNQNSSKIVIAPQLWFADKSLNTKDLIPNSWLKM